MDEVIALLKEHLSKSKVKEKELAFRIDRLLEEFASLKDDLLQEGKCSILSFRCGGKRNCFEDKACVRVARLSDDGYTQT